jgi:hypothetical protein
MLVDGLRLLSSKLTAAKLRMHCYYIATQVRNRKWLDRAMQMGLLAAVAKIAVTAGQLAVRAARMAVVG